ncbi:MAG: twin-arginine translocase TatA/TatE family subunit [Pseudomonadota bacterium]
MGISGISPLSLLLILLIVIVLFGTKRIRTLGKDLGGAVKSFRKGMAEGQAKKSDKKK